MAAWTEFARSQNSYASAYQMVGGIVIPSQRRVYAYEGKHIKVPETVLVAIDRDLISFA